VSGPGNEGERDTGSERGSEVLRFYEQYRIADQVRFYSQRREQFDRATGQGLALSATLLGFSSAAGALAGAALGWGEVWSALATILPAMATALAAYLAVYAFEQQSKIYGDAARAVQAAARPVPDPAAAQDGPAFEQNVADLVKRVEGAMRQEQAQWGQLTSQIQITDQTKA
jgi:type IV secretory pathway VirB6-like protein